MADESLFCINRYNCQPNFGEAGYRLEVRRQGEYQSFVTQVESIPISKNDESRSSYSGVKSNIESIIESNIEY